MKAKPLPIVIAISWGIAFFQYCLQVPANRIASGYFTLAQLKIIQEVITLVVFVLFSIRYMKQKIQLNFLYEGLGVMGAVFFIFRRSAALRPKFVDFLQPPIKVMKCKAFVIRARSLATAMTCLPDLVFLSSRCNKSLYKA